MRERKWAREKSGAHFKPGSRVRLACETVALCVCSRDCVTSKCYYKSSFVPLVQPKCEVSLFFSLSADGLVLVYNCCEKWNVDSIFEIEIIVSNRGKQNRAERLGGEGAVKRCERLNGGHKEDKTTKIRRRWRCNANEQRIWGLHREAATTPTERNVMVCGLSCKIQLKQINRWTKSIQNKCSN